MASEFLEGFLSPFQRSSAVSAPTTKAISATGGAITQGVFSLESGGFARGGKELIAAYSTNPNLRKVVSLIANSLTSVPFYLVRQSKRKGRKTAAIPTQIKSLGSRALRTKAIGRDDKEVVWDHPFLDFLSVGNPLMPGQQGLQASYAYREIKGEFFWQLLREGEKPPFGWVVIPPQNIAELPTADQPRYLMTLNGIQRAIPQADIFWSKVANLSDLWGRGSGVGDSLSDELDSDEYAAALLRYTLANKGFKDTLISIKSEVGAHPDMAEQLEAKYNQRSRGFYNTGRAMVVDGAQIDVKTLTHDLGELKLLDLRAWERDIIRETFGIPPELLGHVENSNRATIDAAEEISARNVQVPRLEAMRLELQLKILPLFDPRGEYLVEYVNPIPEDHARQLEIMQAQPAAFRLNEWRKLAGLPEELWGDSRPQGMAVVEIPAPQSKKAFEGPRLVTKDIDAVTLTARQIDAITDIVDSEELVQRLSPMWQERMTGIAQRAFDAFPGGTGSFALVNPLIEEHLVAFGGQFITHIDPTTKAMVGEAIAAGIAEGEGIGEISRRIRGEMGHLADGYRSRMIARTEVVRSSNVARQIGWEATKLPLKKRYVSALVASTRASHAALHNNTTALNGTWTYSAALEPGIADTIVQPGSSSFPAHAVHCLCTSVAFDPAHTNREIEYGGEEHGMIAKAFEAETTAWEDQAEAVMAPFYKSMTAKMLDELNKQLNRA